MSILIDKNKLRKNLLLEVASFFDHVAINLNNPKRLHLLNVAENIINRIDKENTKDKEILVLWQRIALHKKDYETAIMILNKLRSLIPKKQYHLIWNKLGNVYRAKGEFRVAEKYYRKAIGSSGKQAIYLSNLSTSLASQGQYEQAIISGEKALHYLKIEKINQGGLKKKLQSEISRYRINLNNIK